MKKQIIVLLTTLVFGLTTHVGAQDFNTGSSMMNTGSSLSSNVYGVGAEAIAPMATTTAAAPNRGRTLSGVGEDSDERSEQSPIGAPYVLLFFAAAAAGVIYLRRRQLAAKSQH